MAYDAELKALLKLDLDVPSLTGIQANIGKSVSKLSMSKDMNQFKNDVGEAKRKGIELGTVFDNIKPSVAALSAAVTGFGIGLDAVMTGAIALSPQFKAMLANLKPVFFELSNYLGDKLQPAFDAIVAGAQKFVDTFIQMDQKYHIIDTIAAGIKGIVDEFSKLPGEAQVTIVAGLALLPAFIGVAAVTKWVLGVIGVNGASIVGGSVFLPGIITLGATIAFADLAPKIPSALESTSQSVTQFRRDIEDKYGGLNKFMQNPDIPLGERIIGAGIYGSSNPVAAASNGIMQLEITLQDVTGNKQTAQTVYQVRS
jgi:hypothetical protein